MPSLADGFVWSEPFEGLEPAGEVLGGDEVAEVLPELVMAVVMIAFDRGLLDGPVHPFHLPVGPGMLHPGQAMLVEDVVKGVFVVGMIGELDAPFGVAQQPYWRSSGIGMPWSIIGEHGVGDRDELSHGSDDGDLGRFALFTQAFVEGSNGGVAADGDNGCHVETASR